MIRRLIACFAVLQVLAGCANMQHNRCDCCQVEWSNDASKSFSELAGIASSASKSQGTPR